MNSKSELRKMLEYKPIINPRDKTILFDPYQKQDQKFLDKYSNEHIWTEIINDRGNFISSGVWRIDRNSYVITEQPHSVKNKLNDIWIKLLPRDDQYLYSSRKVA